MDNPWDELREAVTRQRELEKAIRNSANDMAILLVGHLEQVGASNLRALKLELRRFNMSTGRWRKPR